MEKPNANIILNLDKNNLKEINDFNKEEIDI